jgi:hypothetical protein
MHRISATAGTEEQAMAMKWLSMGLLLSASGARAEIVIPSQALQLHERAIVLVSRPDTPANFLRPG